MCVALVEGPGSAPSALSSSHIAGGSGNCYVDDSADVGPRVQVRIQKQERIEAVMVSIPVNVDSRSTARYEQ